MEIMEITCVTSRYLPNMRYIARLLEVDCAITLDLAPLPNQNKNSFISRNRIIDKKGNVFWVSLPIKRKGIKLIKDARIDSTHHSWIEKHIRSIANTYPKHEKFAGDFLVRLEKVLEASDGTLININSLTLSLILELLNIKNIKLVKQSSILQVHNKQHRLDVTRALNASTYVAGHVEWIIMEQLGLIVDMKENGISVIRSPDLDFSVFPRNSTIELSCLHSICTIGFEKSHELIENMVKELKGKRKTNNELCLLIK